MREEVRRCRVARPLVAQWAKVVLHGGPRRVERLREAAHARWEAERALAGQERRPGLAAAAAGLTRAAFGLELLQRWELLGEAAAATWAEARRARALSPACALREWRWLAMLRRWRWRAAARQPAWRGGRGLAGVVVLPASEMRARAMGAAAGDAGPVLA